MISQYDDFHGDEHWLDYSAEDLENWADAQADEDNDEEWLNEHV